MLFNVQSHTKSTYIVHTLCQIWLKSNTLCLIWLHYIMSNLVEAFNLAGDLVVEKELGLIWMRNAQKILRNDRD